MPTPIRLRPGAHAAPVGGGLLITGRGTTRLVRGDAAVLDAVWLRMLPAFHRGTDPARLAGLSSVAAAIIGALDSAGLLLPVDPSWPDHPTLEYLASVAEEPFEAWSRFRALKVSVVGTGPAALAAERALLSFGLAEAELRAADPDVVITVDDAAPVRAGTAWIGIASCGERVVVGPLRTVEGGSALDDALAMLGARPAPTSPVAARLAGNLAAADVLAFGAGLAEAYRWRASVVHVDGARVESVLVTTPGARPLSAEAAPGAAVGPLVAPSPVVDLATSVEVAQSRLLDGRVVLAFGADADEAGENVSLAAARCFVPEEVGGLWHADGTPEPGVGDAVAAAGTSTDGFLRDALLRILSTRISDLTCFTAPRTVVLAGLPATLAPDVAFFGRLGIPLTVAVSELRGAPEAFAAVTVSTYGRLLGFGCGGDEESALLGAFRQATLVVQRGADPCPTRADDGKWDPGPVLDALAASGTPLVTGRWTGAPTTALPAILGWAGLAGLAGGGASARTSSEAVAGATTAATTDATTAPAIEPANTPTTGPTTKPTVEPTIEPTTEED